MTAADSRVSAAPETALLGIARAGLCGSSAPEAMLWDDLDLDDAEDRRFGDYELLERIGRGGMGVVFRARQTSLDREVAVKFIVGSLAADAHAVAHFLAEARAAARLNHPHIVPVFEVGSVEGMHFFSMPLLRGQTLAQRTATRTMPQADSVRLLLDLGAAVDYAHSLGLLHLDLKPANVLFDEHAQPLIGDFGLARHMDDAGGVDAHGVSGTPAYMAPEQIAAGARLDRRTDVYALGAILYELLTGVAPHASDDAKARQSMTGDVVPPRAHDGSIAPDLEAICLKCLEPDPNRRYACVADFNADLVRHRDGHDVSARKPRWHERIARSLRRHPAITLATAAALAALVIGLVTTSWQWQRAEHERAAADRQQALATAQAAHLHRLAGLMAAAFPTGESTRAQRVTSARAAVAWLKHNAPDDPSAQRAVLTSFREALSAAGKADAVSVLLNEIVDQLGVGYRERQVERLARAGDRDSLIAAALIGLPRGADGTSSETHEAVLQRLATAYPDDQLALYVVALACHVQTQQCAHPEYAERLTARFPDNAVHWVLVPGGAGLDDAGIAANVLHAARARDFDDHLPAMTGILRSALHDQQVPDSILEPMQAVIGQAEVAPSLRRNAVDSVALPNYAGVMRVCKPASIDALHIDGLRDACGTFGRHGMRSPEASITACMVTAAIVRRLYKGTPLEAEAKEYRRQYTWLSRYVWLDDYTRRDPDHSDGLQQDLARYGEWEAWRRQAERAGASRTPPPDWLPEDPRLMMLSEERAQVPARP
ncbi:protein kinase [Tahibacter sp. UC22_41]|uniref:serine/threonine-protein kinase n=1 Tax=Tahibacter sp. UC22_41 TaxID=3350178 RepID=UPI0036DAD7DD